MSFNKDVTCHACGRTWRYTGLTPYAQCPSCGKSNNLRDIESDEAEA